MSAEEAPAKDSSPSPPYFNVTTFLPNGDVHHVHEKMELVSPVEGIYVLPGFTRDEVLKYVRHFIDTLADEIMQETVPPTLIFPLDGAVFAYDLLMDRLARSGYEHFRELEVLFAVATGEETYEVPDYYARDGARVIVVDDIADTLDAFEAIAKEIKVRPELYAMSRKALTVVGKFVGYLIEAVFPLINGENPWCNSGFGMNKDRKSSTIVRILERLAAVCVFGTAKDESAYVEFLVANSYYADVLNTQIFHLLSIIDQRTPAEKLSIMREYHEISLIELMHTSQWVQSLPLATIMG